jgi:hypothetical protein
VTKTLRGVVTVALLASASGCIDDFDDPKGYGGRRVACPDLCERSARCEGADPADCERDCDEAEAEVAAAGCSEEYEEFLDCLSRLEDVCRWQEACESTLQRFAICLS